MYHIRPRTILIVEAAPIACGGRWGRFYVFLRRHAGAEAFRPLVFMFMGSASVFMFVRHCFVCGFCGLSTILPSFPVVFHASKLPLLVFSEV